jgi:tRNA (guanine-N7-)-methyltransferase
MRIRKKKHLEERIEKVKDIVLFADRDIANIQLAIKDKKYFDYNNLFNNDNPVSLEVGCGKAGFITEVAKQNPLENYIAVELLQNIIVMGAERVKKEGIKNILFFNSGAEYLPRYIKPSSIKTIFLNFSPPYPAGTYENRRLTKDSLIEAYRDFLIPGGEVLQKTDDKDFFDYSFNQFLKFGFTVEDVSKKIESGEIANVETEYEKKFRAQNMSVYALRARVNK